MSAKDTPTPPYDLATPAGWELAKMPPTLYNALQDAASSKHKYLQQEHMLAQGLHRDLVRKRLAAACAAGWITRLSPGKYGLALWSVRADLWAFFQAQAKLNTPYKRAVRVEKIKQ